MQHADLYRIHIEVGTYRVNLFDYKIRSYLINCADTACVLCGECSHNTGSVDAEC